MVIDSFGLMIVRICCFRVLFFFFVLFLILFPPLRQEANRILEMACSGKSANRQAVTHRDLTDVQGNIMNPFCLRSGYVSLVLLKKHNELTGTEAWNNILTIYPGWVHSNGLCHWVYVSAVHTEEGCCEYRSVGHTHSQAFLQIDWCLRYTLKSHSQDVLPLLN